MRESADVRRANRSAVLAILWQGGSWTKQELARRTGISVPTCNTLLNELAQEGAVVGEPRPTEGRGRTATAFRANECHEPMLLASFDRDRGPTRHLSLELVSVLGRVLERRDREFDRLDYATLLREVDDFIAAHGAAADVAVGTPSLAEGGVVHECDIPELEGEALEERLGADVARPVHLENDMHLKAYGYFHLRGRTDDVVTLANFPEHVLPGTATVHRGMVITGARQFAGMLGFLPLGMGRDELLGRLERPGGVTLAGRMLAAAAVVVNPSAIVCTGSLLQPGDLAEVRSICAETIPRAYLPRLEYAASLDAALREGMRRRLLDRRAAIQGKGN